MTKVVTIEAMFPELRGKYIYATGKGRASTVRVAGGRAFANLLLKVPRQRYTMIKATISVGTEAEVKTVDGKCTCAGSFICPLHTEDTWESTPEAPTRPRKERN
jgi:hypothetical protein